MRGVAGWLGEVVRTVPGVVEAYMPGRGVPGRLREQLALSVAEAADAPLTAWIHQGWLEFLGDRDPDENSGPLFAFAATAASADGPVDATVLSAMYPADVVRSVRATVALTQLSAMVDTAARRLAQQASTRQRRQNAHAARDVVTVVASLPVAVPTSIAAGLMRAVVMLSPRLPVVALPDGDDANLVAQLLAEGVPSYLGHAVVRAGVRYSPVAVAIAFRSEGQAATVRVGKGRIAVDNDVRSDAVLVVDGGVERLLPAIAGSLLRDLGAAATRGR